MGTENRLLDCPSNTVGTHDCVSSQDAGVRCQGTASTCREGDIRLQGGNYQGRVEICYNNIWGTVCDINWQDTQAAVVCKQLGLIPFGKCL